MIAQKSCPPCVPSVAFIRTRSAPASTESSAAFTSGWRSMVTKGRGAGIGPSSASAASLAPTTRECESTTSVATGTACKSSRN